MDRPGTSRYSRTRARFADPADAPGRGARLEIHHRRRGPHHRAADRALRDPGAPLRGGRARRRLPPALRGGRARGSPHRRRGERARGAARVGRRAARRHLRAPRHRLSGGDGCDRNPRRDHPSRAGDLRRLPRAGRGPGRARCDERGGGAYAGRRDLRGDGGGGGRGESARGAPPLRPDARGAAGLLHLGGRERNPDDHGRSGEQPVPGPLPRPGWPQLRRLRDAEPDPRPGARHRRHLPNGGPGGAAYHLQRRPRGGRHLGQRHRQGGGDDGRPPLVGSGGAGCARWALPPHPPGGAGGGADTLGARGSARRGAEGGGTPAPARSRRTRRSSGASAARERRWASPLPRASPAPMPTTR